MVVSRTEPDFRDVQPSPIPIHNLESSNMSAGFETIFEISATQLQSKFRLANNFILHKQVNYLHLGMSKKNLGLSRLF